MSLLKKFIDFLDDANWKYIVEENQIYYSYQGNNLIMEFYIEIDETRQCISFNSEIASRFTQEQYVCGAMACCVANYGLRYGCFNILNDGRILYSVTNFMNDRCGEKAFYFITEHIHQTCDFYNDKFLALQKEQIDFDKFRELVDK